MKKKILGLSAASVAGALAVVGGYLTMPDGQDQHRHLLRWER